MNRRAFFATLLAPFVARWFPRRYHRGLSIRMIRQYDVSSGVPVSRLDVLWGLSVPPARQFYYEPRTRQFEMWPQSPLTGLFGLRDRLLATTSDAIYEVKIES